MNVATAIDGNTARQIARRRTFAIISHPDAGKTTLTEKLLLYGGAVHLAGAIKARRAARHATSDWMEMEKERGISVTSSVLQFDWEGFRLNLLDTPGHQDFSEDTYRTLMAADSAIMLLDNRKGVEEQTRKLFNVCKMRRIPIFIFVNKCDRIGEDPLELLDDVTADLGIGCFPVTWPITEGGRLVGVYDRLDERIHLFQRLADHGQRRVEAREGGLDDPALVDLLGEEAHARLAEEIELLDQASEDFSDAAFEDGALAPTFFGSALTNFGVEPFLRRFLRMAPPPRRRETADGDIEPEDRRFTGFVFKIQANMDPKHRDRIAFLRICSGRFEPGISVRNARSGEILRLATSKQFFGQERRSVEEAWPGDVIGVHDRGSLRIGDTLTSDGRISFGGVPRFSPEHFARVTLGDPLRKKHLEKGLRQLSEEGAVQVFRPDEDGGRETIVGVVGQLQFDVLLHRLEKEYGVGARLDPLPFTRARWIEGGEADLRRAAGGYGSRMVFDLKGRPLVLFESDYVMRTTQERFPDVAFHDVEP